MNINKKLFICVVGGVVYGVLFGRFGRAFMNDLLSGLPKPIVTAAFVLAWAPTIIALLCFADAFDKNSSSVASCSEKRSGRSSLGQFLCGERLWYGEISLATAFWFYNFIGGVFWVFVGRFIIYNYLEGPSVVGAMIMGFAFMLYGLGYQAAAVIGAWRSANRYTGQKIWAWLANVMVVVIFVTVILNVLIELLGKVYAF